MVNTEHRVDDEQHNDGLAAADGSDPVFAPHFKRTNIFWCDGHSSTIDLKG
jgi:prepilin-type processing-associated H-X9-DG protein